MHISLNCFSDILQKNMSKAVVGNNDMIFVLIGVSKIENGGDPDRDKTFA